jgi:hypothetical protein
MFIVELYFRDNAPNSNLKPYDNADQPQKPMDVDLVNAFYIQKSILKNMRRLKKRSTWRTEETRTSGD